MSEPAVAVEPIRVAIADLSADPANARLHDERNLDAVMASLRRFGQQTPIVVGADNVVVAGSARLEAARRLGWTHIDVIRTNLEGAERVAFAIADNRTAELAIWNDETLRTLLAAVREEDADLVGAAGWTDEELAALLIVEPAKGQTDPDAVSDPPAEPVTKPGDLWLLGDHRVLCGDATKAEDVLRVMQGQRAILFATDPPYLIGYDGTNHPHTWNEPDKNKDWSKTYGTTWDEASGNEDLYDKFVAVAVAEAIQPNAAWYCWHASRRQAMVEAVWEKHGAFVHQQIIWAKDRPILTRSWYMWRHEPCFFGWVRPNKPPRVADDYPHSVWELPTVKCGEGTDHPTSKPTEVFAIPMRQHTQPGDVCYEPFAGSGSQIIAAQQLGRRCYGLEIEPKYVDVIVRRWEEFTGQAGVREKA